MVGPDVVNATLGAAFGVAFGGVMTLVDKTIEGLKFVYHCHNQCTTLREHLEMIKPMVLKIIDECDAEEPLKKWLDAFQKCVEDAQNILEKCQDGSNWEKAMEVKYGLQILELKKKITEMLSLSPLAHLMMESKCHMRPCFMAQEIPHKIFGMEDHFTSIKSIVIDGNATQSSKCVGIQGMGGCGKTLLAQMVNNDEEIQKSFGRNSIFWITIGRDAWVPSLYVRMREYLNVQISSETPLEDQRTHLMSEFSKRRVLLILDDVWDNHHVDKDMAYWLNIATGLGSITVLTTRILSIIRCVNASVEVVLLLSEEHSWELFCTHAFGINGPPSNQELVGLAKDVCKECKRLPLALKVIGTTMKWKDEGAEWRSLLQDLQKSNAMDYKCVEHELFHRLQISYDQLDESTKICFLYFAAFPEDWEILPKDLFQMWSAEDLFGDNLDEKDGVDKAHVALNELRRRSLIEECHNDFDELCVKMHDILRDLAIHMTRKGSKVARETLFEPEMKKLKQFPSAWLGFPLKVKRASLGGKIINKYPGNFIAPQLKICLLNPSFDVNSRQYLTSTIEECVIEDSFFTNMANIRYINMHSNTNLKTIPPTIGTLRFLRHLDLSKCVELEKLPESIGALGSLEHLHLRHCKTLKELPESIGGLICLKHLHLSSCNTLMKLPESIGGMESLQHLYLSDCEALMELPEDIGRLGSLQHFDLSSCYALKKLPESIGRLGFLEHLDLSDCEAFMELPESIGELRSLQHFDLSSCYALKKLPDSIERLESLQYLSLSSCNALKKLPDSIGSLGSLQHVDLSNCEALMELPESIGRLKSLQHIDLNFCSALKKIPNGIGGLKSLQHLNLCDCEALMELPESIGGLGSLEHLNLSACYALKELPESIGGLVSLQHLCLSSCYALKEFPENIEGLGALQHLDLSSCYALKAFPKNIGELGSLQYLDLSSCYALTKLPKSIGGLGSLQYLDLSFCEALNELPKSIGELRSCKHLDLSFCKTLKELPESIGGLESLEHLNLSYCKALKGFPNNVEGLKSLQHLDLRYVALEELPKSIERLGSLHQLNFISC